MGILKRILAFVFGLTVACILCSGQSLVDPTQFAGVYVRSTGFTGGSFELKDDGSYTYSSFSDCCDPVHAKTGTFTTRGDKLSFKLATSTINSYNMLDPKQATEAERKLYDYKGRDLTPRELDGDFEMRIITWGDRKYLVETGAIPYFAAAVNLGIEPRNDIINGHFLAVFYYLRKGDEDKTVSGMPRLPDEWKFLIPWSPIDLKIKKVEKRHQHKVITAELPGNKVVKIGMCFIGRQKENKFDNLLVVKSVDKKSITLRNLGLSGLADYRVGEVITTKAKYRDEP